MRRQLSILAIFSAPFFAQTTFASTSAQAALDKTGAASVCASETTAEVEDVETRLNNKLANLKGVLVVSTPVLVQTQIAGETRLNLCVSVVKK